nr:MAG TPA: hypothetical protein [Crassvirales sp.]
MITNANSCHLNFEILYEFKYVKIIRILLIPLISILIHI